MKTSASRLIAGFIFILCISNSYAQNAPVITSVQGKLIRTTPRLADIDKNSMYGVPLKVTRYRDGFTGGIVDPERAEENIFKKAYSVNKNIDKPVLQNGITGGADVPSPNAPTSATNLNMDGIVSSGLAPSDNNMAVGPNHIIQVINASGGTSFKIWNKAGTQVQAQTTLSSITGITGYGDPVVQYDQLADRWLMTEFAAVPSSLSYINTLVLVVSTTGDPTGTWKVYSYTDNTFFVDYPKYAIWNNAYYATSNDFNTAGTSYLGSSIYAFDRTAMLAGAATATMVKTRLNNASQRYYSMAPVCQEGMTTSNQSGLFAFLQDNTWVGGSTSDSIYVFEFTPNFVTPASSVIGPFKQLKTNLAFNTNTGNLSQPSPGSAIQALSQRLMNKVVYRNFGSYESIVCNTTDLQGTGTGVHWWELRRPGSGNWSIYQEGFWHPDNNNRFMGSVTINANGDIGLLYNVVSSSVYPSARFTGRSSCDPLGQMTLAETVVMNGTTYEGNNRYGDYNSLSVDPVNGSYWGTAQYNATGGGTYGNWKTRIVNFTLTSSCGGSGNAGVVSGTSPLCIGATANYTSDGDAGGTWSSSNTSVATVNASSGLVTAVGAGTSNITYTVSGGASAFKTLTVNPNVSAGTVSGASSVCAGANTTFTTNGTTGGTWSSDNTGIATVNASTGVVTGVAAGSANITYAVNSGCGSPVSASKSISVTSCAGPTITCPANISTSTTTCNKSVATSNPTISNTTILTWALTGATTGNSSGTGINYVGTRTFNLGVTTIKYTASNGSTNVTCSFTITVTNPAAITCPANINKTLTGRKCNTSITVSNPSTSGNCSVTKLTWVMTGATTGSSSSSGINYVGTKTFNVGITTVTYTLTNSTGSIATCSFTVTVRNTRCAGSPAEPDATGDMVTTNTGKLILKVFPNPSETYFTLLIQSPSTENVEISVYSISGKLIQKMKGSAFESYRFGDSYTPGTYIVKVQQGSKQSSIKVVR